MTFWDFCNAHPLLILVMCLCFWSAVDTALGLVQAHLRAPRCTPPFPEDDETADDCEKKGDP